MEGVKQWLQLVGLGIKGRCQRLVEYVTSMWHYYGNSTFRRVDLALVFNYLFDNPYSASRKFALLHGEENIHTYGETPLTTLETIVKRCDIHKDDLFFELGCGRGRSCFWLHSFVGCPVVGIEYNPHFAGIAQKIVTKFGLKEIDFRCEDLLTSDYSKATVVYLYGSCLDDNFLVNLVEKLKRLPAGAKVITVSYPLTDYMYEPIFELVDSFDVPFTWGTATVYYQQKRTN